MACDWGCCVQDNDGWTALMVACGTGRTDIVTLLLAVPGVDVNAVNVSCVSVNACVCRHVVLHMVDLVVDWTPLCAECRRYCAHACA